MFGNNPFGALQVEGSSQASNTAGPSTRQVDGDEVDAEWLQLSKTNGEVYVRVSERIDLQGLPQECNLLAVSNQWGLVIVGGSSDVRIHRLRDVQKLLEESSKDDLPISNPLHVLPLPARPVWVRLAMNEEKLVVATLNGAGICVYRLKDVLGGDTTPYHTFDSSIPTSLVNLLPKPSPSSPVIALLSKEELVIADMDARSLSTPIAGSFTSGSWSAKGKQIAIGTTSGKIVQYTPEGIAKAEIPAPPELESDQYYPSFLQWLENDLFIACYARHDGTLEDPLEVFVIQRTKESITYTKYFDLLDTMGVQGRSGLYRHFAGLKGWGDNTKHLAFLVSGLATEIGVLHGSAQNGGSQWELLMLGETARAVLPAAKPGVIEEDTSVLGLDFDLTAEKPVVRGMQGGVELPDMPPPPRLLAYSQEGLLISFNVLYPDAEAYPGTITPQEFASRTGDDAMDVGTTSDTPAAIEPSKPSFTGLGSSSTAFGSTIPSTTPSKPPAFGSSAFGQSTTPAFGQSGFGSTTPTSTPSKPAFGASAFGSKPAFGQSANAGNTTDGSAGQSAFGQPAAPAFGSSAFGQPSKPAFGSSAFGSTSSLSAFGESAFGQTSKPGSTGSAFGSSAFGQTSSPSASSSAFCQSAFGQSPKPLDSPASSSSTSTGFSGFGAKGIGASAFGSSAFGKPSSDTKGTTPPAASTTSAFGGSVSSAFGQSAFGAKAPASQTDNKSPFAGFGQSASPATSPFSGFGAAKKESSPSTSPAAPSNDFGMGGLGSMLGEPSGAAAVPGLEDSPPGSPVLQGGKAGHVPGLDEDSPPTTPAPLPKPSSSCASSSASSSSASAFIKPATAFGGSTSSGFGAFGQAKTSSPFGQSTGAFGTTSTPTAFGKSASSSAFGSPSSFGKTATPPSTSTAGSAFGQQPKPVSAVSGSAFGQSSKPVGFGQSSIPAPNTSGFGNISGGFGGFAQKTATSETKPSSGGFGGFGQSSSAGGFGGFAAKAGQGSIFGGAKESTSPAPSIFGAGSKNTSLTPAPRDEKQEDAITVKEESSLSPPESTKDAETDVMPAADPEPAVMPAGYDVPTASASANPSEQAPAKEAEKATAIPLPRAESPADEKEEDTASRNSEEGVLVEHDEVPPLPMDVAKTQEVGTAAVKDAERDYRDERDETPVAEQYEDEYEEEGEGYDENGEEYDEEDYEGEDAEDEDDYPDDEEDEEGEEEGAEDEDEDEGEASLRRSSSIPAPDMSPISEEATDLEESEEEPAEDAMKTPKSPPTWFAKTSPSSTQPISPSPAPSSLFDRLGPSPASTSTPPLVQPQPVSAAQKLPPAFNLKHAVRTSSPLGQPPQVASDSPATSPVKPPAPQFNLFGSGKGSGKVEEVDKVDKPATPTAQASLFGAGTTKSAPSFGLGLGKPPVQQATPSTFAGFGQASTTSKPASETGTSLFAGFGQTTQSPLPSAPSTFSGVGQPASTPQQSFEAPAKPIPLSKPADPIKPESFTIPKRQVVASPQQIQDDGRRTMSAVLERLIDGLKKDIDHLKSVLEANAKYHKLFTVADLPAVNASNLDKHADLPFSSLKDVEKIVDELAIQLGKYTAGDDNLDIGIVDLQTRLYKSDMKVGQAERLIKAKEESLFKQTSEDVELNSEQRASQVQLKRAAQVTQSALLQLEAGVANLKIQLESAHGTSSAISLSELNKAIRKIDATIKDRASTIDELSDRISSMRVGDGSQAPNSTIVKTAAPRPNPNIRIAEKPALDTLDALDRNLDRQAALKARFGRKSEGRARVNKLELESSSREGLTHAALVGGPVSIDSVPLPGTVAFTPPPPTPRASTTEPESTGFGAVKFDLLDPGKMTPSSSASRKSHGTPRSHETAPRFERSPSAGASPTTSTLSFAPPPLNFDSSKQAPKGFFGFGDFGKK